MKKLFSIINFFLFVFSTCMADIKQQNSIILFTNARNEKNMKEWAAHHLLLGFDFVYIFDHKSDKPLVEEFENFDARVTIERCEWDNPVKIPLMTHAVDLAKNLNASWMLYLDADEFLVLNDFTHVQELLDAFSHADSIGINWLFFGSNYHVKEPKGLIIDNYTRSELLLNHHIKTFVRPLEAVRINNPHYYRLKNPEKMYTINNKTADPQKAYFNKWETEYFHAPAYIAHFVNQSEETYFSRKVSLPRDDIGLFREQAPNIHLEFNDIENLSVKKKYSSQVKAFLEKYSYDEN
ncbi:MAG TPA: glycosyltransferase family 2 protein [Parachlamydiaceae bacterium]|nr:glycosyltransferase family 2 protein [Parachlamydiaceae bacterium]